MKSLLSVLLLFVFCTAGAQRFYYIETSTLVDQLLKTRLEKANQYVVSSAMSSEYTIRTKVGDGGSDRELNLEIVLADSVTQKEIFRTNEQFCFANGNEQPELLRTMAIRSFLQRRIGEIVLTAAQDHTGMFNRELRARKDKT